MHEPFEIIFQDAAIVVLNKIARILIQPSPKKEKYTLTSLLAETLKMAVYPCHRLDRETSGLIVYAKSQSIQEKVMNEFRRGAVKKRYLAFVRGRLRQQKGILEGYILDREGKRYGERPKKAKTSYCVLKEYKAFSVVELEPFTGRTNQLRIQLANIGNPILGERKYAFGKDFKIRFRRLALHACFLSFIHPLTGQKLHYRLDMPQDMRDFLEKY